MLSIALAAILCIACIAAMAITQYIRFGITSEYYELLAPILMCPILLLGAAIPLLIARAVFSWRLARHKESFVHATSGGISELLTTTAIVAAAIMCVQSIDGFIPGSTREVLFMVLVVCSILAFASLISVIPAVWLFFRTRNPLKRLLVMLALAGLAISISVAGALIANLPSFGVTFGLATRQLLFYSSVMPLAGSVYFIAGLYALHLSGYRLARKPRTSTAVATAAEIFDALPPGAISTSTENSSSASSEDHSPSIPDLTSPHFWTHRRLAIACFCLLAAAPLCAAVVSANRASQLEALGALEQELVDAGGRLVRNRDEDILEIALPGDLPASSLAGVGRLNQIEKLKILGVYDRGLLDVFGTDNLTHLDVSGTNFSDADIGILDAFPRLTTIDVSETSITAAGLEQLVVHRNVRELGASELDIPWNDFVTALSKSAISGLKIGGPSLTPDRLASLMAAVPPIAKLNLANSPIDESALKYIGSVVDLNLDGTQISDQAFSKFIAKTTALDLSVANTNLTDAVLPALSDVPFTSLDLSGTKITDAGLANTSPMSWTHLALRDTNLTGDFFEIWLQNQWGVHSLNLTGTNVNDRGMRHLAQYPNILAVNLANTKITANAVKAFCEAGIYRQLHIAGCDVSVQDLQTVSFGNAQLHVGFDQFTKNELKQLRRIFTVRVGVKLDYP